MSDNFEMLVDVDVTIDEAEEVMRVVLEKLQNVGLITSQSDRECTFGGDGFKPGPSIQDAYVLGKNEGAFWELRTCGVEPQVGRHFNDWALGPVCEGFECPTCGASIEPFDESFQDALGTAICAWTDQSGSLLVSCPKCQSDHPVTDWPCKPPLGFGNLSFRFWNWPPLTSSSWTTDVSAIVGEATGHTIVRTYGHI